MVAGVLPSKYSSTFLGLIESYKAQMVKATNDEARAEKALTSIFKDMMTAYACQIVGTPYDSPTARAPSASPSTTTRWRTRTSARSSSSTVRSSATERWTAVQEALERGENVVMLGNHQSEGDAAFIPLSPRCPTQASASASRTSRAIAW